MRSTPSGASVSVDGVVKGETPLALRELANGTLNVTVARRGYLPETRRVVITSARPARSLDVRLAAEAAAPPPPRPQAAPADDARQAGAAGSGGDDRCAEHRFASERRGSDDQRSSRAATRRLTINDLPPGEYQILMAMPGYRNFTTTVRVVAGERVRAAASLTALEQQ